MAGEACTEENETSSYVDPSCTAENDLTRLYDASESANGKKPVPSPPE